jgi:glycine dehydrogenase subunit 1
MSERFSHRFIPNTTPGRREEMLREAGFDSVDEIYQEIPEALRFSGKLDLPHEPATEAQVASRVRAALDKNRTTEGLISFLGAGCWPHYVPALCGEIAGRSEFLTAYAGGDAVDHGRYQAMFEYQSMMGDLLEMDYVSAPVYDGATAGGDAVQMASRATGQRVVLIPQTINPVVRATLQNYSDPWVDLREVAADPHTGQMDLSDLREKISADTAAVFVENPGYLGVIETQCAEIAEIAHRNGALLIVSVNPASLGVLAPPGQYGADIACGEAQPLGLPMACGGATAGILACDDGERFLELMPSFLVGIADTVEEGEYAFSWHTLWERMVYASRDRARSFTGTSSWLWGIAAAVYLALLGPGGMAKLGEVNMQKARYAMDSLARIDGVKAPVFASPHFNEFAVNFDGTGKTVAEINEALLDQGVLGGVDLSGDFGWLGQSALYCVTETHSKGNIDTLVSALRTALAGG